LRRPAPGIESDQRPSGRRGGSVWVFLVRGYFALKTPIKGVGFPWILSSKSRLINGLHGINRGKFFLAVFAPWAFESPERKGDREGTRKRRSVHRESLTYVLILFNLLSRRPFPRSRLNPEQLALVQSSISWTGFDPNQTLVASP
jgi:hypothetical protein